MLNQLLCLSPLAEQVPPAQMPSLHVRRREYGMPHLGWASTWRTAAAAILQVRLSCFPAACARQTRGLLADRLCNLPSAAPVSPRPCGGWPDHQASPAPARGPAQDLRRSWAAGPGVRVPGLLCRLRCIPGGGWLPCAQQSLCQTRHRTGTATHAPQYGQRRPAQPSKTPAGRTPMRCAAQSLSCSWACWQPSPA